jgi:putative ABC transport system permease protein
VLSYEFWRRRFGGDQAIVGKRLEAGTSSFEIIGVTQPGLTLPMPGPFSSTANLAGLTLDVWRPLRVSPVGPFHNNHPYVGIGRLKAGATVDMANKEINAMMPRLIDFAPQAYTASFMKNYNFRGEVRPLKDAVLGAMVPKVLWAIFGSVVLVLLIAVANVANLFIVRMDSRRREATIRTALGADRVHLAAHYLSESLLLCTTAAIVGVALSAAGLKALLAIAPRNIPRLDAISVSWESITFAIALALLMGVIFGLMPLVRRSLDLTALREGGRGLSISRAQRAFRSGLVVAQMAFALILLASAGLMIRSFAHLRAVKPGLDASSTLVFDVALSFSEYDTREKGIAFHSEFQRRLSGLPGVASVGVGSVTDMPLDGGYGTGCAVVWREDRPYPPGQQPACVHTQIALPGYFEAMRMTVRGRTPTWADVNGRTQAVVITKALGDRLWPGEDPIGKGIGSNGAAAKYWYRIVGVIPELRAEALDQAPTEAVFYAATNPDTSQNRRDGSLTGLTYAVRTKGVDPLSLVPAVRKIMTEMNPRIPFIEARTMEAVVAHSMQRTSFLMILLGISASVALLLSAVGIYGVISYVVTQRRFEIGVRIALGARVGEVAELVMMQSVRLALVGIALGLVGTFAVTTLLKALLFNVSPMDPLVLGLVALTLLIIAGLASFAPARRAARIDPVEALRAD